MSEITLKNKELLKETLVSLGCQPNDVEENDEIRFSYKGEMFCAIVEGNFTRIWDLPFTQINENDPDWPIMLETINSVNSRNGHVCRLMEPDEKGVRDVASKTDFVFTEFVPDLQNYLSYMLNNFFILKYEFTQEYTRRKNQMGFNGPSDASSIEPSQN